jgi:hypothetical protein
MKSRCKAMTAKQKSEITTVPRQRPSRNNGSTVGRGVFYVFRSEAISHNRPTSVQIDPRVEAGSNTSTVTLRVVGGDETGSLKSERVKYGRESQGTRARERLRWQEPAVCTKDRPVLTSERAPHKNRTVTVKQ